MQSTALPTRHHDETDGLSPAESRLAVAVAFGKRLSELAGEFGVQITTLRTQLSSILKKCEVERQSDLVRLISNIPVVRLTPSTAVFPAGREAAPTGGELQHIL
jgi:DNA-binding CsgD family transcriptional regulator